ARFGRLHAGDAAATTCHTDLQCSNAAPSLDRPAFAVCPPRWGRSASHLLACRAAADSPPVPLRPPCAARGSERTRLRGSWNARVSANHDLRHPLAAQDRTDSQLRTALAAQAFIAPK